MRTLTDLEQWQLEGNSAEAYEHYLVPAIFAASAERLLDRVTPRSGDRVLDVACGTGIVARRAAPRVGVSGMVVGLDLNDGMLAVARSVSSSSVPTIDWRQGNAADLPFSDATFDVVCCQQALQFFPDPVRVLREMHRVLGPGGRLAIAVCRSIAHNPLYGQLADALTRHAGADAGMMMRAPFPDWDTSRLREMINASGFRKIHLSIEIAPVRYPSAEEFIRREVASSPLSGLIATLNAAALQALVRDVATVTRPHTDDDGVVVPLAIYLVDATR